MELAEAERVIVIFRRELHDWGGPLSPSGRRRPKWNYIVSRYKSINKKTGSEGRKRSATAPGHLIGAVRNTHI
jgi:hypothetical protein